MARTVLITGGSGTLGRELAPLLRSEGWTVRSCDVSPFEQPGIEFRETDLRRPDDVRRAVDGVDAVIHTAAWHGIHLREHPSRDFWELNVDGTYNLLEAAVEAGVQAIVLSSTMGVYGSSSSPSGDEPAVRVHEALPLRPGDMYGQSKVMSERLVAYFARTHGLRAAALRYGMFVPEPFGHYGIRMLYGGVDVRDVASANVAALRSLEAATDFAAYNIFSPLPFGDGDLEELRTDPMAVVERHWPDAPRLLGEIDAKPWGPINVVYDIGLATRRLGWRPRFGFAQFIDGLRRGASSATELVPDGVTATPTGASM
ncbi:MAG TPA: NAD(P)-dependent oxidoreductase [Candidatus Limnocylindria bacterium]